MARTGQIVPRAPAKVCVHKGRAPLMYEFYTSGKDFIAAVLSSLRKESLLIK